MALHLQLLHPECALDRHRCGELYLHSPRFALRLRQQLTSAERGVQALLECPEGIAEENALSFGLMLRDEMVGLVKVYVGFPDASRATLGLLLVDERYQRRHVGSQAVEALSRKARQWPDVQRWTLHARDDDPVALAFWRSCGFATLQPGCLLPGFHGSFSLMERPLKCRRKGPRDLTDGLASSQPDHPFRPFVGR